MKIKTITTHDVYNYGASLQAYALMTYLQQMGHDVEIIDYKPAYLTNRYNYMWVNPESRFHRYWITRVIYRALKYLQRQTTMGRKKKFDYYTSHILRKTRKCYYSNEELKKDCPEADLYIVGSDQVWNSFYDQGKDPAFYLDFIKDDSRKYAYSASFSIKELDEKFQLIVKQFLKKFSGIAVRERQGVEILKKMGLHGTWVLDPVFLLSNRHWELQLQPFKKRKPYLLIYDFERNKLMEKFAIEYARNNDMDIYSINDTYPLLYADKNFNSAGPLDFITLIYHCDCFISNSFHGSAFSIIFQKEFFVFGRNRHKVNERMLSLLSMFHLEDRYVTEGNMGTSHQKINFKNVELLMKEHLNSSIHYINNMLG